MQTRWFEIEILAASPMHFGDVTLVPYSRIARAVAVVAPRFDLDSASPRDVDTGRAV